VVVVAGDERHAGIALDGARRGAGVAQVEGVVGGGAAGSPGSPRLASSWAVVQREMAGPVVAVFEEPQPARAAMAAVR